ncbi:LuxR C-terminal-related transcriptional regulator [Streptomyces osmaniensis]|uniref:LuxR C-terminal-related transcriptional regulator n=1 Tax=Streptomyces osmaniensis TaxID=593134 RepID=UPI001C3226D7|nr:hypothetical protein KJK32_46700 [Streptomyces sp. JCM17656]
MPFLTDIEYGVLEGRANGLNATAIAARLQYSYRAIEDAATRTVRKLGARDMAHAVFLACHAGLLDGRPQRHGDHAGFAAHRYRDEEPCEACWEGERAYRRDRRAARKANVA